MSQNAKKSQINEYSDILDTELVLHSNLCAMSKRVVFVVCHVGSSVMRHSHWLPLGDCKTCMFHILYSKK